MRFVPTEKKKRIQYDMDKRREEQGKTVIHLHEQPPKPKSRLPTDSEMNQAFLDFISVNGREPTILKTPFQWAWSETGFAIQGLPPCPARDITSPYLRPGRWIPVRVVYDPNVVEATIE
jgi:hypothetical protein